MRHLTKLGPVLGLVTLGCGRGSPALPPGPPAGDPVVARAGAAAIHASELVADMTGHPGLDARRSVEARIDFELLAQAAARARLPLATVDDVLAVKSMEVQRLLEREVEPQLGIDAIPQGEVRALYERGKRRYVHGRLVQATVLCVFTGARMKAEPRARAERVAQELSAYLEAHPARLPADFDALAKQAAWADRKVNVATVWQDEERDEPFPLVVARALARLQKPGQQTPLVGDETGYYIAMYVDERPPERRSFAEVEASLRQEMFEPWRRHRFLRLTADLAAGHDIAVFPETLAAAAQTEN